MSDGFMQATSTLPPEGALFVRPSSYASYSLCGYRSVYADKEGFDSGSNEAPGKGTGAHALIENFLTSGELVTETEDILALWAKVMQERDEDLWSYAPEPYLRTLALELGHSLMVWHNTFWLPVGQHLNILATEERVMRGLGVLPSGREVWVSGAPDLIAEATVFDWKTAGRGWKPGKALSNSVQVNAYAWLSEHQTEVNTGVFVVYDWSKRTWTWEDTTVPITPTTMQLSLLSLWDMAKSLDSGIAVATPHTRGGFGDGRGWHCSPKFCGAWNVCDFRSLLPDGKGQAVRGPIRWDTEG